MEQRNTAGTFLNPVGVLLKTEASFEWGLHRQIDFDISTFCVPVSRTIFGLETAFFTAEEIFANSIASRLDDGPAYLLARINPFAVASD